MCQVSLWSSFCNLMYHATTLFTQPASVASLSRHLHSLIHTQSSAIATVACSAKGGGLVRIIFTRPPPHYLYCTAGDNSCGVGLGTRLASTYFCCLDACVVLVSHGHTPFRKRGEGSGNFFYSSLFPPQCGTNHSAVFYHISAVITTSTGNHKM